MAIKHTTQVSTAHVNNSDKAVSKDAWNESHTIESGTVVAGLLSDTAGDTYFGYVVFGYNNGVGLPNAATQAKIDALTAANIDVNRIAWVDLGDGNGNFGIPSFTMQAVFTPPTLKGIQIGTMTVPSFTATAALNIPTLEGLVAPPLSTLTWTIQGAITDSTFIVPSFTETMSLTPPTLKGGVAMIVSPRTMTMNLSAPTLVGTTAVSSTLDWYVLSIS